MDESVIGREHRANDDGERSSVVAVVESGSAGRSALQLTMLAVGVMAVLQASAADAAGVTNDEGGVAGVLQVAAGKAMGGGKAGASAAVVQVLALMWLRTAMNYQYRYGGTLASSLTALWSQGGVPRFYQGLPFAILQGPLSRFGDTAANVGVLSLLDDSSLPIPIQTACASAAAGLWRILLTPIDTSKTVSQVEGAPGLKRLYDRVITLGPGPLYQGALASASATVVGHFPWFLTYNFLNAALPPVDDAGDPFHSIVRSALLGLSASCVSDCCSNSLRVIKTTKQTATLLQQQQTPPFIINKDDTTTTTTTNDKQQQRQQQQNGEISYSQVVTLILEQDGWKGLFGRGLQTRLLTNAIQGTAFSILWKYFQTTQQQ